MSYVLTLSALTTQSNGRLMVESQIRGAISTAESVMGVISLCQIIEHIRPADC